MSAVHQRLKLKQTPIDTWSLKEQLTLASAVQRTGDQNWVSVSRTMKQFWEPGRPPDWYSQKNCALQYNLIMEKADLPRRKRGEKLEGKDSPGMTVVRTLGEQRQAQLKLIIEEEKKEIERLEKQVERLGSENLTQEEMDEILKEIEKEEEEEARRDEEHRLFISSREEKKQAIEAALKTGLYWKGQSVRSSLSEQSGSEIDSAMDSPITEENIQVVEADQEGGDLNAGAGQSSRGGKENPGHSSDNQRRDSEPHTSGDMVEQETERSCTQAAPAAPVHQEAASVPQPVPELTVAAVQSGPPLEESGPPVEESGPPVEESGTPLPESGPPVPESGPPESVSCTLEAEREATVAQEKFPSPVKSEEEGVVVKRELMEESCKEKELKGEQVATFELVNLETPKKKEFDAIKTEIKAEVDEAEAPSVEVEFKDKDEDDEVINDAEEITGGDMEDEQTEAPPAKQTDMPSAKQTDTPSDKQTETPAANQTDSPELCVTEKEEKRPEESAVFEIPNTELEPMEAEQATAAADTVGAPAAEAVCPPAVAEAPVKLTPRRGRPRLKKNSEAGASGLTLAAGTGKQGTKDDNDQSDVTTSRASSPDSHRPTSPSPEVKTRSGSRESEAGKRGSGRRSSRNSGSRGIKDGGGDSTPGSPAPLTSCPSSFVSSQEDEKEARAWRKSILLVWSQIAAHKHASLFAGPVSEAEAPEYRNIVYQPMDLGTIKKNVESGAIRTTEEFQRDLSLMFLNATMYNSSDHAVYRLTLSMKKDTDNIVKEFLHTQALMKASEAPKLRMKDIIEGPLSRTRTGSGSYTPEERKKTVEDKRKRTSTVEEYPAAKKRRLRNLDE